MFDRATARILYARFIYSAAPVGMTQAHWARCLRSFEGVVLSDKKWRRMLSTDELLLLQAMLRVGDAGDGLSLQLAADTILAQSRTQACWSWPPIVWGKGGELLMSIGNIAGAAELLERALTFSHQGHWEKRVKHLKQAGRTFRTYIRQQKMTTNGELSELVALPITRLSKPSIETFVEVAALPHKPVVILDEASTWKAMKWKAEGNMLSKCPKASATITYAQPEASLEFANLAHSKEGTLSEYLTDYLVDEKQLSLGQKGAKQRMAVPDEDNRTSLSPRSPYFWDLSLHDECPQILEDIVRHACIS